MPELHDILTTTIKKRLQESAYISSLPAFSGGGFFILRLEYRDGLAMTYSTGRPELDRLSFPLEATQSFKTFVHTPIRPVSSKEALSAIMEEDFSNVRSQLEAGSFVQFKKQFPVGDARVDLFREQILLLELFFNERRATSFGCAVKSLDDVFWIISGIYVFGVPFAVAILSGNSFDKDKVDSGQEALPELLSALIVEECEDAVFGQISNGILDGIREGRTVGRAVMKPVTDFVGALPWKDISEINVVANDLYHKSLGASPLTFEWPEFDGISGKPRQIVDSGKARFQTRLENLLGGIEDLTNTTRARLRSSVVAGIASQSLSHNIGSHALSDARLFDSNKIADGDGLKDFHQYLQGRMDYVAQLIARTPPQPEPLYLWGDLLGEFFRQRLLLNRLVADRSVEGHNLSFLIELPLSTEKCGDDVVPCGDRVAAVQMMHVWLKKRSDELSFAPTEMGEGVIRKKIAPVRRHCVYPTDTGGGKRQWWQMLGVSWKDIELALGLIADKDGAAGGGRAKTGIPMAGPLEDLLVAIPGGGVGRHALYSILENLMRNSVKYGERRKASNDLCIHLRVRNPDTQDGELKKSEDYWLLEIWDEFSGFGKEVEQQERYEKLAESFRQDVIDDEGKTRTSGHGLVEIKEAMRFLHDHKDNSESDETGSPSPWACRPHCHRTSPAHGESTCREGCQQGRAECCHANLANVFDADYDGIPLTVGTLVYRVRLRRPRLLGVWAPGLDFGEEVCSSVSKGVFFRRSLTETGGSAQPLAELCAHLLVIRDPDTDQIERMVEKLAKEHWRLPFRLFVVTSGEERAQVWKTAITKFERRVPVAPDPVTKGEFLPKNRIRALNAPELHKKLGTPGENLLELAFVNEVYDHWLLAYKPLSDSKRWHLAVCLDRDRETVERLWSVAEKSEIQKLKSVSVTAYFNQITPAQNDRYGNPVPKKEETIPVVGKMDWKASEDTVRHLIHFGNHGCKPPGDAAELAITNQTVAFSQSFGSTEAPRTFNLLYSPPTDVEGFIFFALNVAEAALTKIAIFDERTTGVFLNDKTKRFNKVRVAEGSLAGVSPLLAIGAEHTSVGAFTIDNIDWEGMKKDLDTARPELPSKAHLAPNVILDSVSGNSSLQFNEVRESDILVLHEGLIEELVSKEHFTLGTEFCFFREFAQIVRTSGKGRDARKLAAFLPFCEYSAISAVMAPYTSDKEHVRLDKIMLAKAVMNTFGQTPSQKQSS